MSEIILTKEAAPTNPPTGKETLYVNAAGQLTLRDETGAEQVFAGSFPVTPGFVDGNFDSWQANTTYSLSAATDTYTADMWIANAGTGGAATVSQDTPAVGTEPSGMTRGRKYRLKYQQTTNASTAPTIGQKLEGAQQFNGQSVTVSAYLAAAVAGTLVTGVQVTQNFGSGGSTSVVTTKTVSWVVGTAETRFSARVDIPSVAGKSFGAGNDFVRVDLLLATGATYTLYCSQLQIDVCSASASADTAGNGGVPQPFRWAGLSIELPRVLRYYRRIKSSNTPCSGVTNSGVAFIINPIMRGVPAFSSSLTDANFVSGASPGANQWALALSGVTFVSKSSGTISISGANSTPEALSIAISNAVMNSSYNFLTLGSGMYFDFDARL